MTEKRSEFGPREGQQDGPARPQRQQRGVRLDVEVLLAAEGAARGDLRDQHLLRGEAEERGDLAAVLPGTLPLREDVEPQAADAASGRRPGTAPPPSPGSGAVLRHGQAGLRLEVGVLDGGGRERVGRDVGGARDGGLHIAALQPGHGDDVAALVDGGRTVGHGREGVA